MFTTIGCFTVVAHEQDADTIVIRAPAREDLDALRRHHLPDLQITGDHALVSRDEWEHLALQLARAVDYREVDEARFMQRLQSVAAGSTSRSAAAESEHHLG